MVLNERLEALAFIPDDPGKYSASLRHESNRDHRWDSGWVTEAIAFLQTPKA